MTGSHAQPLSASTASSGFAVTLNAPVAVANQGVFAAIFGNAQFSGGSITTNSCVYLGQAGGPPATTTISTTTTGSVTPVNGTPIPVASVAGFPASGSILIIQPGYVVTIAYSGVDTAANQFTGTTFPAGASGLAKNALVALPNILGDTINVVSTTEFATSGTLMVEAPPGYLPNQNLILSYTGTTPTSFTGVSGFGDSQMPSGGVIVQPATPSPSLGYVLAPYGQNLPLINLFPDAPYPATPSTVTATFALPDPSTQGVLGGVMVISVGSAIAIPVTGTQAAPSAGSPTPATNPNDIFGLLEWGIGDTIDFDVSEVDQVGFPFQVTTTGTSPPPPADPTLGVGMRLARDELFTGFSAYIGTLGAAAAPFLAGAADNPTAPFAANTRLTAPQDIVDVFEGDPPVALGARPTGGTGSAVTAYYAITAVSAAGESMASNVVTGVTTTAQSQLLVTWSAYPYAVSYNVYWSASITASNGLVNPIRVAAGVTATNWTDTSPASHSGPTATPPINNYGYDPLNQYFTQTIKDFFAFYWPPNQFVLDDQATLTKWTGQTQHYVDGDGNTYTQLALTGGAGQWGNQFAGQTLNICQPLFSSNTDDTSLPPAPAWLTATYNAWESASSMVFAADGVFGNVTAPGSTLAVGIAKDIYNDIVSALNRGITPRQVNGQWQVLPPTYWASSPLLSTAVVSSTGGTLAAGTYRYAITAVCVDQVLQQGSVTSATNATPIVITAAANGLQTGDRVSIAGVTGNTNANGTFPVTVIDANTFSIPASGNGAYVSGGTWQQVTETTPSNIVTVSATGATSSVVLTWLPANPPGGTIGAGTVAGFNVYRSQLKQQGGGWTGLQKLNETPIMNGTPPVTAYTDTGGSTTYGPPPFVYYDSDATANFYAAYFSRLDVSINGLGYGFPYADKNGQSTNVQMNLPGPTGLVITLLPWTG